MRILFSFPVILSLFIGYTCFGMEEKESTGLANIYTIQKGMFQEPLQYYVNNDHTNLPVKQDWKKMMVQSTCENPIFKVSEMAAMPIEFIAKQLDVINTARLGDQPLDVATEKEIRTYFAKSKLGNKAFTTNLYKLDHPQETGFFVSMPSGCTWVNVNRFKKCSKKEREEQTIAEGNFKAYYGPEAKIIVPGMIGFGTIYGAKMAYKRIPFQYRATASKHFGKAVGVAGLYFVTQSAAKHFFVPKVAMKVSDSVAKTGMEMAAGDRIFDNVIAYREPTTNDDNSGKTEK